MTADRPVRVLGEVLGSTGEDPLGPGDPLEVARLVRRALAAAGRRAFEVKALALVADDEPDRAMLSRFARRALGPHGSDVPTEGRAGVGLDHDARLGVATILVRGWLGSGVAMGGSVVIVVARGPGTEVTVRCMTLGPA